MAVALEVRWDPAVVVVGVTVAIVPVVSWIVSL